MKYIFKIKNLEIQVITKLYYYIMLLLNFILIFNEKNV